HARVVKTGQYRQVRDAADVDHAARLACREYRVMKRRHQRCALSAEGHVAAAKIGDGGDPRQRRDQVRVTQLNRAAYPAARSVVDGLAMAAECRYAASR